MKSAPNKWKIPGWVTRALACSATVAVLSVVAAACGNNMNGPGQGPQLTTGAGGDAGSAGDGGGGSAPCPENATRDCHVTLPSHENVTSCFDGVQTCIDGRWGPCVEPDMPKPAPPSQPSRQANPHILSLSMPVACNTDPCDPSCQTFQEVPAMPIASLPQNLIAPWQVGGYGKLPPAKQTLASAEPCGQGQDCEVDQYCSNPTSGTCSHSKCVTGTGLNIGCDPCVQSICSIAANATCCNTAVVGTCAHDLCVTGAALDKVAPCHACVASICAKSQFAYCCDSVNGGWTSECVAQVALTCSNNSCTSGNWTQTCADKVASVCDASCLKDTVAPVCAHDKCDIGGPLDGTCDSCVASVCAMDSFCCQTVGGAWNGQCVQEVASVCGQSCPAKGDCVPWLPSQVDSACAQWDLTVGVGCTDAGGVPQIPVCNHGNATAPSGLPVVKLPPAASFPANRCNPSLAGGTTYTTPTSIAPGKCVDVAMPGLADGSLIVANPQAAVGYNNTECHCDNNWSVYSSAVGTCATPSCAGASTFAKLKKVKMFINVDRSTSESYVLSGLAGMPTRWSQLIGALNTFAADPASDDIAVWLRFWPYSDPDATIGLCPAAALTQCNPLQGCTRADKKMGAAAPADVVNLIGANQTIITDELTYMLGVAPSGNTPMYPALEGSLIAAKTFKLNPANAGTEPVVLMVTDGDPLSNCNNSVDDIAAMAATYFNAYGIRTYVIGIAEINQLTVNKIAGAGGGKGFFIQLGVNIPVQTQMIQALNDIKQSFVSCTISLPNQAIFDPAQATLVYTTGGGMVNNLTQVANAGACAGSGWYYDNAASPTSMTLCPTTCSAVKADVSGTLELKIACISQYLSSTQKQVYAASCPKGTVPQWGFLAYDTVDPSDSYARFSVHTSDVSNSFLSPLLPAATARSTPSDTQKCLMAGPSPCPIDLFTTLGGLPEAQRPYLELVMDVNPSTDQKATSKINNWQITYSCPDAE